MIINPEAKSYDERMITLLKTLITPDRRRWIALAVVCMGQLMMVLDATIVNVALPSMQRDLGFSQANLAWVVDAYMIAFGSFLLLAGRLGDLLGRKRMFLIGLILFTLASVACGIADSQGLLIGARFVQGLGGAVASAAVLALLVTEFPEPAERAVAMSVYTFIVASGGSIGLLAGGVLTQAVSWHWIFFINVPIGLVTFMLGRALINETERLGLGHGVDVIGSLLVTVALMLGVYAIVKATDYGWLSLHTVGFGVAALALLAVFVAVESRLANPMFPLRILRVPGLAASSVVRGFLVTGMFSTFLLGVLYLQHVHGYGALRTGLAFLPLTLVLGLSSVGITARLMERFGPTRVLVAGLITITASLFLLSRLPAHTAYLPAIFVPFTLLGVGAGLSFLPLTMIAMAEVPSADAGLASGIVNASLQISAAIGIAALGTVAAERTKVLAGLGQHHLQALTGGFHLAWAIGAGAVAIGALITLLALRPPQRPDEVIRLEEREPAEFQLEAA
ncbi:MAG: MFS transporter [Sinobacteraceae bacterium]|nr:MFS transporter [Nevskiaceae bacterium]